LPWQADTGKIVLVKCYYSMDAADTIISPTDIVINNISNYKGWGQYSDLDTSTGYIEFYGRTGIENLRFTLTASNGLWFYTNNVGTEDYDVWSTYAVSGTPTIKRLTQAGSYALGHQRYAHSGERILSTVHLDLDDQPQLKKPEFFKCLTCMLATGDQRATTEHNHIPIPHDIIDWFDDSVLEADANLLPGQRFHMDFGFMKGSGYSKEDEEGRTITSIDGYRSYLLIIDHKTRYLWVFLRKTKKLPLDIVEKFLKEHGHPTAHNRTVRTDKGGELWGSQAFRKVVDDNGYIMDPTAPKSSFQNGMSERPNRTLAKMVRSLLHGAGLGPEYWSFALLHGVFIKNRIRHSATNQVPYTMYTGVKPSAKRLRVFGCPIIVRNVGPRPAKLDLNTTVGTFLGYTATDKNVIYMDSVTKKIKTATHVIFDEAGYTLPAVQLTPLAKALQQFGSGEEEAVETPAAATAKEATSKLQVKCLSLHATIPTRATDGSAGCDLYSAIDITIMPKTRACIPLDITFIPPVGTYGQILSRSGLAAKYCVDVKAGTIDKDYTGNVQVLLENNGEKPFQVKIGNRIAQLVLYTIETPEVTKLPKLLLLLGETMDSGVQVYPNSHRNQLRHMCHLTMNRRHHASVQTLQWMIQQNHTIFISAMTRSTVYSNAT
jgi:dUTP pyrophosphatase